MAETRLCILAENILNPETLELFYAKLREDETDAKIILLGALDAAYFAGQIPPSIAPSVYQILDLPYEMMEALRVRNYAETRGQALA